MSGDFAPDRSKRWYPVLVLVRHYGESYRDVDMFALLSLLSVAILGLALLPTDDEASDDAAPDPEFDPLQVVPLAQPDTAGEDSILFTGDEDDDVSAGGGDDYVDGEGGNDLLSGEDGDDELHGGQGDDQLDGSAGADELLGHVGNDWLLGGDGNDQLNGGDGDDVLDGGEGDDALLGYLGDDRLDGGDGADVLFGGHGDDRLDGGQDLVRDFINGGAGADVLNGRANDNLNGGEGADQFWLAAEAAGAGSINLDDFNPGEDMLVVQYQGTVAPVLSLQTVPEGLALFADGELLATLNGNPALDLSAIQLVAA